jgi:hypothetical protein
MAQRFEGRSIRQRQCALRHTRHPLQKRVYWLGRCLHDCSLGTLHEIRRSGNSGKAVRQHERLGRLFGKPRRKELSGTGRPSFWRLDVLRASLNNEPKPGHTDVDLIATAYYARSAYLTAKTAGVLHQLEDQNKYEALFEKIKTAFQYEFVTPSGRLSPNSQTAYVLALAFELLEEKKIPKAVEYLVDNIKKTRLSSVDRIFGYAPIMSGTHGTWSHGYSLSITATGKLPLLVVPGQERRHDHVGALGRHRARRQFSGSLCQLFQSLRQGSRRRLDVQCGWGEFSMMRKNQAINILSSSQSLLPTWNMPKWNWNHLMD